MKTTLGEITDEILQAVEAYHTASMGNDPYEIATTKSEYEQMISIYGAKAVALAVEYYNKEVIGRAK